MLFVVFIVLLDEANGQMSFRGLKWGGADELPAHLDSMLT